MRESWYQIKSDTNKFARISELFEIFSKAGRHMNIRIAFGCFILFLSNGALAVLIGMGPTYGSVSPSGRNITVGSGEDACRAWASYNQQKVLAINGAGEGSVSCTITADTDPFSETMLFYADYTCPMNSEAMYAGDGNQLPTCECSLGMLELGERCIDTNLYPDYSIGDPDPVTAPPDPGKDSGCNQSNIAESNDDLSLNGNPCNASNARKLQLLDIVSSAGTRAPSLQVLYNSQTVDNTAYWYYGGFGVGWSSKYDRRVNVITSDLVQVRRPDGKLLAFKLVGQQYVPDADIKDILTRIPDVNGGTIGWLYRSVKSGEMERYDSNGSLINLSDLSGASETITYQSPIQGDSGPSKIANISDLSGRGLTFKYDGFGRVNNITDPTGQEYTITHDENGNIISVTYPDTPTSSKHLYFNEPSNATGLNVPNYLTGIVDEAGARYADFSYDAAGRAVVTQHANGSYKFQLNYADVNTYITDPLGTVRTDTFSTILGIRRITSILQPYKSGQAEMSFGYDPNGNVTSLDNFNGYRTCSSFDMNRNLRIVAVEGLVGGFDCASVTSMSAPLPAGSRKISTSWHPTWGVKIREAAPRKITTWIYNGQPDPTNGNQLINCAPTTAKLSDGSPIVVLCKFVEQSTSDTNGSQGFAAALDSTISSKTWNFTYNDWGQVLTMTDPLGKQTTYSYYQDTSFSGVDPSAVGHSAGDLQSETNSVGHTTLYNAYDKAGRLLLMTSPTGLTTAYSYWPRGWLRAVKRCDAATCDIASSTGGLLTSYDYWPTGLLKQVSQPDGSTLNYSYDDAHRLVRVSDAAGNTISYTLDNTGNRIGEQIKDPNGNLASNITRSYDPLNRLQSVTGAAQ